MRPISGRAVAASVAARARRRPRYDLLVPSLCGVVALFFVAVLLMGSAPLARADGRHIDTIVFNRDVDPASARLLEDAIGRAEGDGAALLVIEMDTPGGDIESAKAVTQAELASTVPVVVYVSPSGGRAGSAGTYIALAAPFIAMAPDTRIGAASPIDGSGQNLPSTLDTKIKNDLSAFARGVQTTYHRNVPLAVATITEAASYTDQEALDGQLINLRAASLDDLLAALDGTSTTLANGTSVTLALAHASLQRLEPTFANQAESVFLDPNVLFLLFVVSAICIYLELAHPGALVPGVVGVLTLLLFLFGSQALAPNYTGLALMLLAVVLLALDVRAPTHGVLTVGGLLSLVIGALIFFDSGTARGASGVSPIVLGGVVVGVALVSLTVVRIAIAAQRSPVTTGSEGLIGQHATVIEALSPDGRVRVLGENWAARLDEPAATLGPSVDQGEPVLVRRVEGLRLIVEPERL